MADPEGADRTNDFVRGAKLTLEKILAEKRDAAILKAKSPSCGIGRVYDGTFSGSLTRGDGVTARMIMDSGTPAFDENNTPPNW